MSGIEVLGGIFIALGIPLVVWRSRLGATGLKGRWKDVRLFDDGKPIQRSDRWWAWLFAGVLSLIGVIAFMVIRGSAVGGFFLVLLPSLLIRTGFDKRRGGRPTDPARLNAIILGLLGAAFIGAGVVLLVSQ